jgi:hypothetical protein
VPGDEGAGVTACIGPTHNDFLCTGSGQYAQYGVCQTCSGTNQDKVANSARTGCEHCSLGKVKDGPFPETATCISGKTIRPICGTAQYAQYGVCQYCDAGKVSNCPGTGCDHCPAGSYKFVPLLHQPALCSQHFVSAAWSQCSLIWRLHATNALFPDSPLVTTCRTPNASTTPAPIFRAPVRVSTRSTASVRLVPAPAKTRWPTLPAPAATTARPARSSKWRRASTTSLPRAPHRRIWLCGVTAVLSNFRHLRGPRGFPPVPCRVPRGRGSTPASTATTTSLRVSERASTRSTASVRLALAPAKTRWQTLPAPAATTVHPARSSTWRRAPTTPLPRVFGFVTWPRCSLTSAPCVRPSCPQVSHRCRGGR